ncbi:MAG TPA: hypothetical protein VGQ57_17170, partial [Polyangiaceae bacterium]|nr:hypothetical protein [Polyangiaceae bacterium]
MNRLCFFVLLLLTACSSDDDDSTGGSSGKGGSGGSNGAQGGSSHGATGGANAQGGSVNATGGKGGSANGGKGGSGKGGSGGTSTHQGGSGGDSVPGGESGAAGTGDSGSSTGGSSTGGSGAATYYGDSHSGNFWLGPVDYAETEWHNACAPSNKYPQGIQELYGTNIMGLANEVMLEGLTASNGELCDTCVELTANGKTLIARAVTYGQETGPNDIDVSPEIDAELDGNAGRNVTWRFVKCSENSSVEYTFDGRDWSNTWFFRVWVRNARVPVNKVEVRVGSGDWSTADWQTDGAWQASSQDFSGGFSLRVTAIDGQTLVDD